MKPSLTHHPVTLAPPPLPGYLVERTDQARSLGLSEGQQVTRRVFSRTPAIRRLSRMRRLVLGAADHIQAAATHGGKRCKPAMVTLTYRPDADWRPRQISALMQRIRDYLARRGAKLRAIWVLELHRSGRPHYHVLIWLPKGVTLPKPDKQGWWPHGHTRIEWARRAVAYLSKYTSKGNIDPAELPRGARVYGIYGAPLRLDWYRAPAWLRQIARVGQTIRRELGGWWGVEELAHAWRSPWRLVRMTEAEVEVEWVGWTPADVMDLWTLRHSAPTTSTSIH